jgi:hypothetical protein
MFVLSRALRNPHDTIGVRFFWKYPIFDLTAISYTTVMSGKLDSPVGTYALRTVDDLPEKVYERDVHSPLRAYF